MAKLYWKKNGASRPRAGVDIWVGLIPGDPDDRVMCIIDVDFGRDKFIRTFTSIAPDLAHGRRFCEAAYRRLSAQRLTAIRPTAKGSK